MENYSYVSLLTNNSYVYGIALLVESMKKVNTKYPLHVLVTDEVSPATLNMLDQLKVTYELVDKIKISDTIHEHNMSYDKKMAAIWKYCWTKFAIFKLTQFDKIVFLDADIMVMKNLDHLFELPHMTAALDGEIFNIWPDWPHFNSGCVVIEPKQELFDSILDFALNLKDLPEYVIADQEILNLYYKDWVNKKELHLNKYYNVFGPYIPESMEEEIKKECYFIHYVGRKPWQVWFKHPEEKYTELFYQMAAEDVKRICATINIDQMRKYLKLTVYAICKNEKTYIDKWLQCFSAADYVCVLDTGSTDGTWEKLQKAQKKYKNLIIDQKEIKPWRFDTARNESLTLVPKDTTIYFMVDLDEIIKEKDWVKKIKGAWTPAFERGEYTYNRDVRDNDVVVRAIPEYRIHSNWWDHYRNVVHEALYNRAEQKQFYTETCTKIDITVWHYPKADKVTNYAELCEKDLEECPDDYVMRLQLAIEYEILQEYDKAMMHYQWLVEHENTLHQYEKARCWFGLGRITNTLGDSNKALFYYAEGRLTCTKLIDNYIDAAIIYYNNQKYKQAIDLCKEGLNNCYEAAWCGVYDATSFYPFYIIGMCYYFLEDRLNALAWLELAYMKNPMDETIQKQKFEISQMLISELNDTSKAGLY